MSNNIKMLREAKALSLEALGKLCNTDASQIYRLETGERQLTQKWMEIISKALECRPSDLIEDFCYGSLTEKGASKYRSPGSISKQGERLPKGNYIDTSFLTKATLMAKELADKNIISKKEIEWLALEAAEKATIMKDHIITKELLLHILEQRKHKN